MDSLTKTRTGRIWLRNRRSRYGALHQPGNSRMKPTWMSVMLWSRRQAPKRISHAKFAEMQAGKCVTYCFLCVGAMRIRSLQGDKWGLRSPRARGWLDSGGSGLAGAPVEAAWDEFIREPVPAGYRRFAGWCTSNRVDETPLPPPARLGAAWTLLSDPFGIAEKPTAPHPHAVPRCSNLRLHVRLRRLLACFLALLIRKPPLLRTLKSSEQKEPRLPLHLAEAALGDHSTRDNRSRLPKYNFTVADTYGRKFRSNNTLWKFHFRPGSLETPQNAFAMTKHVPADAQRPSSLLPPRPGVFRAPSRQASTPLVPKQADKLKTEATEDEVGDFEEPPPAKRRKIASPTLAGKEPTISSQEQRQDGNVSRPGGLHKASLESLTGWYGDDADLDQLLFGPTSPPTGTAPPPPLPARPRKHKMLSKELQRDAKSIPRARQDVLVPTTPCKVDTPEDGPVVNAPSVADFFPWGGNHPEDVLNEQNVKNGYFDKPPQTWNESHTAKSTVLNAFKHRFSLQTLSALYGSVLQQRAQNQRITSGSAFRPPPRVTLTEQKRRAWLSDLANNAVPLRRLSRTIPQGIRGQLLLEQCLANAVPISRAIWFAKCVGANEIRTLKRKGTSPTFAASVEAKWSKDWTANIQQFIEEIAKDCGKENWRTNISYCLRLTSRLYSENLLDKDSFLDWTLSSAENSPDEQLPAWLIILHIYSKDLARSRRRGARLATVLVDKLHLAYTADEQEPNPLVERLKKFVTDLVTSRPACFLMPQKWQQCEAVLRQCLHPDPARHQNLLEDLRQLNEGASGPVSQPEALSGSPRQAIIQLLDAARAPYRVHQLANDCSRACEDDYLRLTTTIEWSCTKFRHGEQRLYLAVRLLRLWHRNGSDLDGAVHKLLAKNHSFPFLHFQILHHLVTELVRSRHFSVSKYLQWLSARGALRTSFGDEHRILSASHGAHEVEIASQLCDEPTQLLTEIPLLHLPDHVKNLRSTLLSRLGFDISRESAVLHHCKCFLAAQLRDICREADDVLDQYEYREPNLGGLAWASKSELGHWLRSLVAACFPAKGKADFEQAAGGSAEFTLHHFMFIRSILEQIDDISMLADVLSYSSNSRNEAVLASAVDSINAHLESLSAIGALDDLHRRIAQAYVALKVTKVSLPILAISLLDLGNRHPDERLPVHVLQADIARGDKVTIAAYSPFSDGMVESLQQAGSTFIEDFEAVILSEPNMTEQAMTQMFELVAERLKKDQVVANQEESRDSLCLLLARLRVFRPVHFDRLMSKWARSIVASPDHSATTLILALVNFGCLPISAIVQDVQELETDGSCGHFRHSRRNVAWLLCDSVLSASLSTEPAQYRFRTLWAQYLANNPADALSILPVIKSECTKVQLDFNLKRTNWMSPVLSGIALRDSYRSADYGPEVRGLLEEGLGVLFEGDTIGASEGVEIQKVIDVCDAFSLPFCQLHLRITSTHPGSIHQDSRSSIVKALFSLATRDPAVADQEAASGAWVPLAAAASVEIACQLREKAEQAFFGVDVPLLSGRVGASPLAGSHPEASILRAARHLDVVSKMAYTIPETGAPGICSQLNEKLAAVWRALNVNNVPTAATPASGSQMNGPSTSTAMSTDPPVILDYLPLLLRFVCLHREALASKAISPLLAKQSSQEQVKLLVLLVSIALHSTISEQQHLAAQVLDVVATLVDGITEEARAACARCLKDKMRDCRVNYLFGTMTTLVGPEDGGSSLQLVKEGKGVVGDWKVKQWELLEGGADTSLNLGLFQCREGSLKGGPL